MKLVPLSCRVCRSLPKSKDKTFFWTTFIISRATMSAAISSTTEPTASTPPVHHHAQSHKGKGKEKPLASLIAGATAGGLESFVTYPLESLKTQVQFGSIDGGKVCPSPGLYYMELHLEREREFSPSHLGTGSLTISSC